MIGRRSLELKTTPQLQSMQRAGVVLSSALDAAVAAVEQAAIQASCETRRLVGQQAAAFTAAALPLTRPV